METTNFESQNPIPDIQIPVLPSTPTPNKNIFKFLFFIFFGLFLVTLLFSTYLLVKISIKDQNSKTRVENQITENITPTLIPTIVTDETQNWQTYTNSTFNYSIKYPQNWSIIQGHTYAADDSESIKNKSIEIVDNNQKIVMQIYIDSKSQIGNITLNEFVKQITPLDKTKVSNITNYKINTFDGVSALVEFTDKVPGLQSGLRYFVKNNNYYVTFSTEESKISANISNILSTFKFN